MQTLLLRIDGQLLDADAARALRAHVLSASPGMRVEVYAAADPAQPETYVYCTPASADTAGHDLAAVRALADERYPGAATRILDALADLDGASAGEASHWHYVVETDVLPEAEEDFNAWYDQEHMPGLAAVPGSVRARRLRCPDGGPRYHACYDLATQETFGSPPWLAVRATDWSSRVRPSFRNTKRTMFRKVLA
ncbi:DUF4286 family protein [Bordetella genomosp. 1]|uniref:EthD domain-containing protein n=1 Tax=Bordetella genomosp. 1 TaxID=1395607 RepID=A0ABX4EWY9_9BORD|nr:DUF4286 family protein [Bordetella genomosp. 1]OZI58547.1 hypothetical protein CAL27_17795 [Bordetella genomosp. 1]